MSLSRTLGQPAVQALGQLWRDASVKLYFLVSRQSDIPSSNLHDGTCTTDVLVPAPLEAVRGCEPVPVRWEFNAHSEEPTRCLGGREADSAESYLTMSVNPTALFPPYPPRGNSARLRWRVTPTS